MARTDVLDRSNQRSVPVWLFVIVALLIAGRVGMRYVNRKPAAPGGVVAWVAPPQAASEAAGTRKTIMYEFTAEWCPPCKAMEREVFADRDLAGLINRGFVPVRIVDRQREEGSNSPEVARLQTRYAVRAFPTIVFTDAQGNVKKRIEGYAGAAAFERQLRDLAR